MERASQPGLDLHTEDKSEKLPFNLKAKIISIQKGISYREAYGLMLDQEVEEKRQEREKGHAP